MQNTNKGIVIFAKNNEYINYINQAEIAALYAKKHLNVPIVLICDRSEKGLVSPNIFDDVITIQFKTKNKRFMYDKGTKLSLSYFNDLRSEVYDLTPFDETLVIDSDYLIMNPSLTEIWNSEYSFMINSEIQNFEGYSLHTYDKTLSDGGYPVFWATAFYFKKDEFSEQYFKKIKHVKDHYEFYFRSYGIQNMLYRNDYVFSIAYHLLHDNSNIIPPSLPSSQFNVSQKSIIKSFGDDHIIFETEDGSELDSLGLNMHIMNKVDLDRKYYQFLEVFNG